MKRNLPKLILAMTMLLAVPTAAFAVTRYNPYSGRYESVRGDDVITEEEDVLISPALTEEEDVFVGNDMVTQEEDVTGDFFAGGGNIILNGDVKGNAWITGGTITISGNVDGDLYVAGGQINITGDIGQRLFVGGGSVTIDSNVGKDAYFGAGMVTLKGSFGDDVRAGVGQLTIDAEINGDLVAEVGAISKSSETTIGGVEDVTITESAESVDIGETKMPNFENFRFLTQRAAGAWTAWSIFRGVLKMIGWIIVAIIITSFYKEKTARMMTHLGTGENWLFGFGIGALIMIVAPIAGILLLMSVVGAPLAMFGFVMGIYKMIFSSVLMKVWIGNKTLKLLGQENPDNIMSSIVGVGLVSIICLIPCLGPIIKMVLSLIAFGAFIQVCWMKHKEKKVE